MAPRAVYIPTADEVAVAIVAAARACNEDPLIFVQGEKDLRCRHYAAQALKLVLPDIPNDMVGRLVGSRVPNFFVRSRQDRKRRAFGWWSNYVLNKVVRALDAHVAEKKRNPPPPPPKPAVAVEPIIDGRLQVPRSYVSLMPSHSKKANLEKMLRRAVQNTAKLGNEASES